MWVAIGLVLVVTGGAIELRARIVGAWPTGLTWVTIIVGALMIVVVLWPKGRRTRRGFDVLPRHDRGRDERHV